MGERVNGIHEVRGSIPLASIRAGWRGRQGELRGSDREPRLLAGIAQLVEHNLAKVGVAGSSPVSRSPERYENRDTSTRGGAVW